MSDRSVIQLLRERCWCGLTLKPSPFPLDREGMLCCPAYRVGEADPHVRKMPEETDET